jgi:UDP-N-acetylmuramate--alanine ligase
LSAAGAGASVYLVGAGGCGMSGLGHLLLDLDYHVIGSDLQENQEIQQLRARGAHIFRGHSANQLKAAQPVLVVHTSAVGPDNPELQAAREMKLPVVRRAVLLAALLHRQRGVCVAGMHGKTTTSALLAFALDHLQAAPSFAIGWQVPQFTRHARYSPQAARPHPAPGQRRLAPRRMGGAPACVSSAAPYFVIEADESDGTLCEFHPEHALILNVDAEHLDYYADLEAVCQEFKRFAGQTRGDVVYCADDPCLAALFARHPRGVSYGFHPTAEYRILAPVTRAANGSDTPVTGFEIWRRGKRLGAFALQLLGEKNISNAAAVIAFLHRRGYAAECLAPALGAFTGAARRQQELYRDAAIRLFEDYGHHPNEIRATLGALRQLEPRRLLVAFQPHRYTRTKHLLNEFTTCFAAADRLWVTDIYPASEAAIPGVSSVQLAREICARGQAAEFVGSFADLRQRVRQALEPGDLALFLGAGGDITQAAHELADELRSAAPTGVPAGPPS